MQAALSWLAAVRRSRRMMAVLCLALFLPLQLVAASTLLHEMLHADAAAPGHHCVVTLIAQGQVDSPVAGPLVVAAITALCLLLAPLAAAPFVSTDLRLAPGRAPPRR